MPKKTKQTTNAPSPDSVATPTSAKNEKAKPRPTPAKAKKTPAKKAKTVAIKRAASVEPTDDEIRIRAYFISERRHRFNLPGDSSADWIEARRQLLSEGKRK